MNEVSSYGSWRALLVDEDLAARKLVRHLLQKHEDIQVIGEVANIHQATVACQHLQPNVAFMDLSMPPAQGMTDLSKFSTSMEIIFVSAHEEYAAHAFDLGSVDYLLKPLDANRFNLAVSRLRGRALISPHSTAPSAIQKQDADRIVIPLGRGCSVENIAEITSISADGNYSTVRLSDGRELYVYRTLNQWESILPPGDFIRLDRSLMISPTHMVKLKIIKRELAHLHLKGAQNKIDLGRSALQRLRQHLKGPLAAQQELRSPNLAA